MANKYDDEKIREIDLYDLEASDVDDLMHAQYEVQFKDMIHCGNCNYIFSTDDIEYEDSHTCPNCNKSSKLYDCYQDDIDDKNVDDLTDYVGKDVVSKIKEILKKEEGVKMSNNKKLNLQEATIKSLYDGLKDDTEVDDVEGIIDDVLVVTDPEITTDEYNEVIDRAEEIVEDTPEGEIPLDTTYLGEYLQICPICGGSFIKDHILEPGTACPICYETPESFVMIGKLEAEDSVAEDNGLVDEDNKPLEDNGIPLDNLASVEPTDSNTEETEKPEETDTEGAEETETPNAEEVNRPRGARTRLNRRDLASKEIPQGNILTEQLEKKQEDYERYKVSFYVDSTETPRDEIVERLNAVLKNSGLASTKEDIDIEVDEVFEEGKELLLDADKTDDIEDTTPEDKKADDNQKEFEVIKIDESNIEQLHKLVDNSAFTWEGMDASDENLQAIVDDFKDNTNIQLPVKFYIWSGELFNKEFDLTDANAYQNDLTFVSVDLDNWSSLGNLPIYKMQVGARWLDDIVDNNKVRQDKIDDMSNED